MKWWPALVQCAVKGGSSETELRAKIAAGHTVIWDAGAGCFALDRASDGACVVWLGVGDLRTLVAEENAIAAWAREQGCTKVRIEGRKGWLRVFPHWQASESDGVTVLERTI